VCTNAASRARDSDPRFTPVALAGYTAADTPRPECILTARATSREPIAFLWSAPRDTILARRRGLYAAPMQGRGRWVIHHRGAELIHGFLELHRHCRARSSAAARPGGFSGNAFCNKIRKKRSFARGQLLTHNGSRGRRGAAYTIVISRLSWGAKMVLGISAWTPRTMSTTWVTRKLTATLHSA